jgi:hypothetical protein
LSDRLKARGRFESIVPRQLQKPKGQETMIVSFSLAGNSERLILNEIQKKKAKSTEIREVETRGKTAQ